MLCMTANDLIICGIFAFLLTLLGDPHILPYQVLIDQFIHDRANGRVDRSLLRQHPGSLGRFAVRNVLAIVNHGKVVVISLHDPIVRVVRRSTEGHVELSLQWKLIRKADDRLSDAALDRRVR
uniref:Putative secreted protein n=1 Tax=Anopheles darlingi TaxID=43151 RepID=A0A2M4DI05_ANODA